MNNERMPIKKTVKKILAKLPEHDISDDKKREFIARLYDVQEERKKIVKFAPLKEALFPRGVGAVLVLVVLVTGFNYLFSPLYPVISNIKGTVKIYNAARNEWSFAEKANIKLCRNDVLKTFGDGQADLVINGLYHIRLKNNSEIKLACSTSRAISKDIQYILSQGKVFTNYNKMRSIGKELSIETPEAQASALGTAFLVESISAMKTTTVGVLDGVVRVNSLKELGMPKDATGEVMVRAGERTMVREGLVPSKPSRLMENEMLEMEELYSIGKRPQVALLISTGPSRTRELLSVVPIYVVSDAPSPLPEKIDRIVKEFNKAIKERSKEKHIENIDQLESIVNDYPNPKYDVQFLLFIGAYCSGLGEDQRAIATFERVVNKYTNSSLASIAQCAIGIIYEEKVKDFDRAREAYHKVLSNYPNSPEIEEASAGLNRLTR